ncbi:MAG TPA: hypothetical protein VKZ96_09990 [Thermomicrobiales bacterium]|nr:hypothetical protein [Thermomicrobiales bacterium]
MSALRMGYLVICREEGHEQARYFSTYQDAASFIAEQPDPDRWEWFPWPASLSVDIDRAWEPLDSPKKTKRHGKRVPESE